MWSFDRHDLFLFTSGGQCLKAYLSTFLHTSISSRSEYDSFSISFTWLVSLCHIQESSQNLHRKQQYFVTTLTLIRSPITLRSRLRLYWYCLYLAASKSRSILWYGSFKWYLWVRGMLRYSIVQKQSSDFLYKSPP